MTANNRETILSPAKPVFDILNWVAFAGWMYVLFETLSHYDSPDELLSIVQPTVLVLEGICVVEVLRIMLGDLPGNLVLGVILHTIRLVTTFEILGRGPEDHWTGPTILVSWAVTEVSRYPMYIFPKQATARAIRMVVPLVTFPVGAFSEAFGTYMMLLESKTPLWLQIVGVAIIIVNGVLGPAMAYPALLRKGLPVLGLSKRAKKKSAEKKMA